MGCGNPPGLCPPVKGHNKPGLITETIEARDVVWATCDDNNSFGAGLMSSSFISPGNTVFPSYDIDMQGTFQCRENDWESAISWLDGRINLNSLADSQTDANLMHPEFSIRESYNNTVAADRLLESDFDMNVMPGEGESAIGFPIKEYGAEAKTGCISVSQMRRNFSLSGASTSVLPRAEGIGIAGVKDDRNILPFQLGPPEKDDSTFLSLGIGVGTEVRPNSNFSAQEVARKLEEAVSSRPKSSLPAQNSNNLWNDAQLTSSATRMETDVCASPSSAYNLPSRMPNSSLNSMPFSSSQTRDANELTCFPVNSDTFRVDPAPVSLPFGSTSNPHLARSNSSTFVSEPTTSTNFTTQLKFNPLQDSYRKRFMDLSSKSPMNLHSDAHRGISIRHTQLGNLSTRGEGTRAQVSGISSIATSVQPSGNLYSRHNASYAEAQGKSSFPERNNFPVSIGSTVQSAAGGPFPKRLGFQLNDFANARSAEGNSLRDQYSGLVDYFQTPVRPPYATGIPPSHLASQVGIFRPSVHAAGQTWDQHGAPAQFLMDLPRVDYSSGKVVSHQSLKRPAAADLPATSLGQRRKVNPPQPAIRPSNLYQSQIIPLPIPHPAHVPASYQGQIIPPSVPAHIPATYRSQTIQPPILAHIPAPNRSQTIQPPIRPPISAAAAAHISAPYQNMTIPPHAPYRSQIIRPPISAPIPAAAHIPAPYQSHTVRGPIRAPNPAAAHIPAPYQSHIIRSPFQVPSPAAAAAHILATPYYIKWQGGVDATPQPIGQKCLLCKRDLSFTAEGPVFQPSNPPPVAVLPCGHTFHDHCLQIIVPADQTKSPPCIPCAIGEA